MVCEQSNTSPNPKKCPPDFADLPEPVRQAIEVYNKLGDRVYAEIGFVGKDYTLLGSYIEVLGVTDKEIFLEALVRLDAETRRESQEQLKKAREASKKKTNVRH